MLVEMQTSAETSRVGDARFCRLLETVRKHAGSVRWQWGDYHRHRTDKAASVAGT
jgi:hypothetical protein